MRASVIESPISDGKLAALGVSRETMLERIRAAVSFAVEEGIRVAFFGVDSTRADLEFVRAVYESAVDAGAAEVVVVDTLGIATPEAAAFLVNEVAERLDYDTPVHWHGHDDFGLATAAAIAAVQAGATWVHGTVNGMGERAGNADLVEVALALEALYGIPTRLRLEQARELAHLVQERSGTTACALEGGDRGQPLHARVRRGRVAVPRPSRDRAVRLRSSSVRPAASCSGRRAGSTRSGSSSTSSASTFPSRAPRGAARGGQELGDEETRPRDRCRVPTAREPKAWPIEY